MSDDSERSESGSPIYRHSEPSESLPAEVADADAIEEHLARHLGPIEMVYHELASEWIHLDVLQIPAHAERPFHTLVTCGMSARPMTVPDPEVPRYAELVVALPPDWPLDETAWRDERHYWPVRMLKELARLPHVYETWLGIGHTVPNGDPPEPYEPGTNLCGAMIAPPLTFPDDAEVLELDAGPLHFYSVIPLHRDEMELKLASGVEPLFDAFDAAGVSEVLDAGRPSALKRRKRFGVF